MESALPDDLVFLMGKFEARFPTDRRYATNHMWLKPIEGSPNQYRVGFTAYSVRLLRDVYFLDWSIDAGMDVAAKQAIGEIESSKALASLHAPADGRLIQFNEQLLDDPSAINLNNYDAGWIFDLATESTLLTPEEYLKHMESGWDDTQRMIKGQMNEPG